MIRLLRTASCPSQCFRKIQRKNTISGLYILQGQPVAEEIIQHFMNGGNAAELKKDFVRGSRPDYVSPLDDLAFDIYQVSSFLPGNPKVTSLARSHVHFRKQISVV